MPTPLLHRVCAAPLALATVAALAADGDEATRLDPVVVVGSRAAEPLRQVVGSVSTVEREDMDRHGVADIGDLARRVPGLEVPVDSTRFGRQGFNLRGLEGNRVSIEVDGVPLPDGFGLGQFSLAGRDLLDLGGVQRVEVLRGPASTLYGSKALAGVVAYTTRSTEDFLWDGRPWHLGGTLGHASRDNSTLAAAHYAADAGNGWRGFVSLARRDGHETENRPRPGGMAANPADTRRDSALAKLEYDGAARGRWTMTVDHGAGTQQTDVRSLVFGPGRYSTTTALSGDDDWQRDRLSLAGVWATPLPGIDAVDLLLYRQVADVTQRTAQDRLADAQTRYPTLRERRFDFSQRSSGLRLVAQARGETGAVRHWQVFGLDLAQHDYASLRDGREVNLDTGSSTNVVLGEVFPVRDFPPTRTREGGLFWQDEMRLGSRWALVPGLRWEAYRLRAHADAVWQGDNPGSAPSARDTAQWTPKLGLRFAAGEHATLYLQGVRGFRSPPFSDVNIGLYLTSLNYVVKPNPDLKPETSRGLEGGLRWSGQTLQASLALYDNRYRNLIDSRANLGTDPASGALVFQSVNRASARIRGAELEARWRAAGWLAEARASSARGDDTARDRPLNSVPPARASLGLGRETRDGRGGVELLLSGARRVDRVDASAGPLFRPAGYARWDADAWWEFGSGARLSLNLGNLTNRRYWDWNAVRGVAPSARDLDLYTQPGRSLGLTLAADW